jgi:hypothetical protein
MVTAPRPDQRTCADGFVLLTNQRGGYRREGRGLSMTQVSFPVVHYDSDYDLIGQITGQPMQWAVPRGTVP